MSSDDHGHESDHERWWAGLGQEERLLAIETVRLDEDAQSFPGGDRPSAERAEFVRGTPEYLERFASADRIAHVDDTPLGLDAVPDSHEHTRPLEG